MQTPEETLRIRRGSCRDFAVLMMEAARSLGVATRFVDFDPTNSIIGNRNLTRVAVAWSPDQVLPLWGAYTGPTGAFLGMDVSVTVTEAAAP